MTRIRVGHVLDRCVMLVGVLTKTRMGIMWRSCGRQYVLSCSSPSATYDLAPQSGVIFLVKRMGMSASQLQCIITIRNTGSIIFADGRVRISSDFVDSELLLIRLTERRGLYSGSHHGCGSIWALHWKSSPCMMPRYIHELMSRAAFRCLTSKGMPHVPILNSCP